MKDGKEGIPASAVEEGTGMKKRGSRRRVQKGGGKAARAGAGLRWTRKFVQASFLALFILSVWAVSYPPAGFPDENLFLRLDPLAAFSAARYGVWLYLLPAWVLLGITMVSGRFFCAWICPLGTVLGSVPSPRRRRGRRLSRLRPKDLLGRPITGDHLRVRLKYLFLAVLLLLLVAGTNLLWIFDPLVIANRAVSFVFLAGIPVIFIALLLLAVVWGPRFWCREICPVGACFSLASMAGARLPAAASPFSLVKDGEKCTHCGACAAACPFGVMEVADSEKSGRLALPDCALCGDCVAACPVEGALALTVMGRGIVVSGPEERGRSMEDGTVCGI